MDEIVSQSHWQVARMQVRPVAVQSVQRPPPEPQLLFALPTEHTKLPASLPQQPPLQLVMFVLLQTLVQLAVAVLQAWPGTPTPGLAARQSPAAEQPQV
jgi:hypothetical protein